MVWIWATIGLLALVHILQAWCRNKKKRLPPGPRGFPVFGNLHLLSGEFPNKDLHRLAQKYGDVMHMWLVLFPPLSSLPRRLPSCSSKHTTLFLQLVHLMKVQSISLLAKGT
ncbi:cytochrome P450 CYP736A12-like [Prunus yedoensis var. nudiflora]|uniref:Cytochrome P450 CYP736A12-like n=1 Tax=Prunus yedoensis var. nudiflora TaxID=2094558 RepID=A0A314YJX1_PRUYE|nr:cytochrome P450 CYP736A12-like [Prunus yedoensis var. nudiflora]